MGETEGLRVFEQFARSEHGREIHTLHYHLDISVAEMQRELVPIQKAILVESVSYWKDREEQKAKQKTKH